MANTWDKIKNKGAELKGEVKNEYQNMKDDMSGRDHKDEAAYRRGETQAMRGTSGAVDREARDRATDSVTDRNSPIERNLDGSVDTKAAEARGMAKNEMKHQNKQEEKGYKDQRDDMKR